jgi:hypothetical protein
MDHTPRDSSVAQAPPAMHNPAWSQGFTGPVTPIEIRSTIEESKLI